MKGILVVLITSLLVLIFTALLALIGFIPLIIYTISQGWV